MAIETRYAQILLVEDDPDEIVMTCRALASSNLLNDVHVASDGNEAVEFVERRGLFGPSTPRPDLVLLDVNLPGTSGLNVLGHIRSNPETALVPVIMLTGSTNADDISRSYALGANTYIQKPMESSRFMETVHVLAEYWVGAATFPPMAA